jgi:hypothetical protein
LGKQNQGSVVEAKEIGMRFDGATYSPEHDEARLTGQNQRVHALMQDGEWRTLEEISSATGAPQASVSARLRDLRKERFGGFIVDRRHRGDPSRGLYEYRLESPRPPALVQAEMFA